MAFGKTVGKLLTVFGPTQVEAEQAGTEAESDQDIEMSGGEAAENGMRKPQNMSDPRLPSEDEEKGTPGKSPAVQKLVP